MLLQTSGEETETEKKHQEEKVLVWLVDKALSLPESKCRAHCLFPLSLGKFRTLSSWVNFSCRNCDATKEHNQCSKSIPLLQRRLTSTQRVSPSLAFKFSSFHDLPGLFFPALDSV